MKAVFYISSLIAIASTILAITRANPVNALLNLILSLLAIAVIFQTLGAPFIAALEVIIYAGAIMVVFVFTVMLLNAGKSEQEEASWLKPAMWVMPGIFAAVLLFEVIYLLTAVGTKSDASGSLTPQQVGTALWGPYALGVELASMLLLAGLIGGCRLGRKPAMEQPAPSRTKETAA